MAKPNCAGRVYEPHIPRMSKSEFVGNLKELGLSYEEVRDNKGEWNESRKLYIDGCFFHRIMKGEKANWRYLDDEVQKIYGRGEPT